MAQQMLSREEVSALKTEKPYHYTSILRNKYPDTWADMIAYNTEHGFDVGKIGYPQIVYNWMHTIEEWPKCEVCGKPSAFTTMGKFGYCPTCSRLCARRAKTTMDKRRNTSLAKYGTEFATQAESVKAKIRAANREKYGTDCILSLPEFQEKVRATNLKRYGVEYPTMSQEIRDRRAANNLRKYGAESPMQLESVKQQARETTIERFGAFPAPQSLQNCLDYSAEKLEMAYESLKTKFPDYELLTTRDAYEHRLGHLKWKCRLCGRTFDTYKRTSLFPRCKCQHRDQEEVGFYSFVKGIAPDAVFNTRKTLPSGREIDVYVPSRKIGFEFDGLYWHSELRVPNAYHLEKTREAESIGIRLVHVFSDEWEKKQDIVKSFIRSLLSPHTHENNIYARKCECREIGKEEAHAFLDRTHIQGADNAKTYIGLFHEKTLCAVGSFQPETREGSSYTLSRYSTDGGTVCGGLGKILAFFIRTYHPSKIKTYADRRISQGALYEATGFKNTGVLKPRYWYTKDFKTRIHRFNFRKDAMRKAGFNCPDGMTESQIAELNGFTRIYDCGYIRYEMLCD